MITGTITSKGQITIPAEVRLALKLRTGDRIAFERSPTGGFFQPSEKSVGNGTQGNVWQTVKVGFHQRDECSDC
jgi:antitoxin PrlF